MLAIPSSAIDCVAALVAALRPTEGTAPAMPLRVAMALYDVVYVVARVWALLSLLQKIAAALALGTYHYVYLLWQVVWSSVLCPLEYMYT